MNALTSIMKPTFDPESPDSNMLAVFERINARKAHHYGFDDIPDELIPWDEIEATAPQDQADDDELLASVARTLPGVSARLLWLISSVDSSRWVERGLIDQGFLALHREIARLDGHAQQIANAVHELISIEWQQNLVAYEKSAGDFEIALRLKSLVDGEITGAERDVHFSADLIALADALEERFSNEVYLRRLVRTLVPDHAAFLRKVEIIIAEGYHEDVTPWLARDTNYLVGRIDDAEPTQGEAS